MSVKWNAGAINQNVKPPVWTACDYLGPYNGVQCYMNNLGEFPDEFSGKEVLTATIELVGKTYLAVTKIPGVLDGIGKAMHEGDGASYHDLMSDMKGCRQGFKECKARSVYYNDNGKEPNDDELKKMQFQNLDDKTSDMLHADLSAALHNLTGGNPVVDFFAGFVSGGASYVDETLNGALSVIGWGCGFLRGLTTKGQDPFVEAQKSAYLGANSCNLSGAWDSLMTKTGVVNVNSGAYGVGKFAGNIATSTVITAMIPGGAATRAYQYTTAFTTTFGTTVKNDINALGGVDKIDSTDARAITKHATTRGGISLLTSVITSTANSSHPVGAYTAGDVGAKTFKEGWKKAGDKITRNVLANGTISFISDLANQGADYKYHKDNLDKEYKYDIGKAGTHAVTSMGVSLVTNTINMNNSKKSITKYDDMSKDTKKIMKSFEKVSDTKAKQTYVSAGKNSVSKVTKSASYYLHKEMSKDHGISNNIIKVTASTAGKWVESVYEKASKK